MDDYFDLVRIEEEDRHRLIKEYSFGMKNKLQLLCSLIKNPKIILMSTHIMQLAKDISDEIVILKNGVLAKAEMQNENEAEFEQRILKLLEEEE